LAAFFVASSNVFPFSRFSVDSANFDSMNTAQLKYELIEKLVRTEDEQLLTKVAKLMGSVPIPYPKNELKPMSVEEFNERIQRAEDDIAAGRVYTTEEAKNKLGL